MQIRSDPGKALHNPDINFHLYQVISATYPSHIKFEPYKIWYGPYVAFMLYQVISAQFLLKPDTNPISAPDMGQI